MKGSALGVHSKNPSSTTAQSLLQLILKSCCAFVAGQFCHRRRGRRGGERSHGVAVPVTNTSQNFPRLIWSDQWTMAEFVLFIVLPKTQIRDAHFWNWPWKSRKKQKLILFSSTPSSHSCSYISSESPVILQLMLTAHRVVIPQQCLQK